MEANINKRNLSYSIVNTIGDSNLKALRRLNKGKIIIIATLLRTGIIELKDWLY
jgi:hypothetical protein